MNYPERFWKILRGSSRRKTTSTSFDIPLPIAVHPQENIARFSKSSRHFGNGRVKHGAFMPPVGRTTLSVFRIENLSKNDIWLIGEKTAKEANQTLYGYGNLIISSVIALGLSIEADNIPPRHAHIADLPPDKSDQKEIALQLAEMAKLVLKPN